ncbi:MAG: hypothetical protein MRJ92_04755 [Nitrospira sp.]|nr:hypothetical protein [Nitrospira sp.]
MTYVECIEGIVAGLLAMVATLFVCIDIAYSAKNGSPSGTSGGSIREQDRHARENQPSPSSVET